MFKEGDRVIYKGNLKSLKSRVGIVCEPYRTSPDLVVVRFNNSLWKLCFNPETLSLL